MIKLVDEILKELPWQLIPKDPKEKPKNKDKPVKNEVR